MYKVIGKDTLRAGLHEYFSKFAWKNTEYTDFTNTLAQAYKNSTKRIDMGANFDFNKWADSWLKQSGINILEPVVEYGADGSIKSLAIKQEAPAIGSNLLRKHVIDIVAFDEAFNAWVIEDVVVQDQAITQIPAEKFSHLAAIKTLVLNSGDFAYAKIRFD